MRYLYEILRKNEPQNILTGDFWRSDTLYPAVAKNIRRQSFEDTKIGENAGKTLTWKSKRIFLTMSEILETK